MNYYMQFSVTIERVSEQEAVWLKQRLEEIDEEDGLVFEYKLKETTL